MPDDIVVELITLLGANWNPANTLNQTPEIHSGYHVAARGKFQIAVRAVPDEFSLGSSGVSGIKSDGKPVQILRGLAFVECIAEHDDTGTFNAEKLSFLAKNEAHRIIMANYHLFTDYDYVGYVGSNKIVPTVSERPALYKYQVRVGFQWRYETP